MTLFYKNYLYLCNQNHKSPSVVAVELGFNRSANTAWSRGSLPKPINRQAIADYFNVELDDLFFRDITGSGKTAKDSAERINLTKEEAELIASWRKADEDRKNIVSAALATYGFQHEKEKEIIGYVG